MAKKVELPRCAVFRDTNEHDGHGWVFPRGEFLDGTVERNLYTGDYSLDGYYEDKYFVIERKASMAELVGNITNKEKWDDFKDELSRLEAFAHPFVICEFPFSCFRTFPEHSGIPEKVWPKLKVQRPFLIRRMQEIELRFKTKFVFCDTQAAARDYVFGLFKRVIESRAPANRPD